MWGNVNISLPVHNVQEPGFIDPAVTVIHNPRSRSSLRSNGARLTEPTFPTGAALLWFVLVKLPKQEIQFENKFKKIPQKQNLIEGSKGIGSFIPKRLCLFRKGEPFLSLKSKAFNFLSLKAKASNFSLLGIQSAKNEEAELGRTRIINLAFFYKITDCSRLLGFLIIF